MIYLQAEYLFPPARMLLHPYINKLQLILSSFFLPIILISIMGCCESKLLYPPPVYTLNQEVQEVQESEIISKLSKKDLVEIGVSGQQQNHIRHSQYSLEQDFGDLLDNFQFFQQPLTQTFLEGKNKEKSQIKENKEIHDQLKLQTLCKQGKPEAKETYADIDMNSQSGTDEQEEGEQSQLYINNSKLLSNISINTKRLLEKQLFYINSSKIGNTNLLKWTQKDRLPVDFEDMKIEDILKVQKSLTYVSTLLLIQLYDRCNNLKLLAIKKSQNFIGIRIFVNGIKRMLEIKSSFGENSLKKLMLEIPNSLIHLNSTQLCNWVFTLTGWVPEEINMHKFPQSNEIFKRLIKNFQNGNILIGFTNHNQNQFLLIKNLYQQIETLTAIKLYWDSSKNIITQDVTLSWHDVPKRYPFLNVNWNPLIYGFTKKVQSLSTIEFKENRSTRTKPGFIVDIPPSEQEIQIRILVQLHLPTPTSQNKFNIKLYQQDRSFTNLQQRQPIRDSTSANGIYLSQIFIFERSHQSSQFILIVQLEDTSNEEDIQITIDFFSFCQINVRKLVKPQLIVTRMLQTQINPQNAGFGMNSPFFNKNLHFSITSIKGTLCKIKARFQTNEPIIFELCLLPDNANCKDITLIKPEELAKDILQSDQFEGSGVLQFVANKSHYILILVCFTPVFGKVNIEMQVYNMNSEITYENCRGSFGIEEIVSAPQFWREYCFEWTNSSPGPRKRTKHNCGKDFYPISTFQIFFLNPSADIQLSQGTYQFSVISKDFLEQFSDPFLLQNGSKQQVCQKFLTACPPSLSLGIFELNKAKSQVKIIVDDSQYVPYGIGFWTAPLQLKGLYRFVFPKMEKKSQQGVFKIRKLSNNI